MGFFSFINGNKTVASENSDTTKNDKGKRLSDQVNKPDPERMAMALDKLRTEVLNAKDKANPSYGDLYRMYENTLTDSEVLTQREIAINKVIAEPFAISVDKADNEELTALLERPWFSAFLEYCFDNELWPYTLLEFNPNFDDNGEFTEVITFPRFNVYQFNKNIIVDETDTTGIPYENDDPDKGELINPTDFYLLELPYKDDSVGRLEPLTREVIMLSFARRDWNEHSEKWGQPRIVIKTDAEGDGLNTIERGASTFSRNGYAIVGLDEEVEKFEASSNGSGYLIYDKNIDKCYHNISKIINGQHGTGDEKSFVGSAEVSERILNDFHSSRLRRFQNIINYKLFPFLNNFGYPLENAKFRFTVLDAKPSVKAESDDIDPDDQKTDPPKQPTARLLSAVEVKKKAVVVPW